MMGRDNTLVLDDLKAAWTQFERRADQDLSRMEEMTSVLADDRARTLVSRSMWLPLIELVTTVVGLGLVILGLGQEGSSVYFACLISISVLFVILIASAIWQIAMVTMIAPAAPVITMQRQLARLRTLRIFETKWILLLSPVLWAPFLVVIVEMFMKLVIGVEGTVFSGEFVIANLVIGGLISLGLVWLSVRFADRLEGTSFLRGLLDDFAGRRLTKAREFLSRLDGFEADDS